MSMSKRDGYGANVTCVGWRNWIIMVILFCSTCRVSYEIFASSSRTKTYPARDMSNIFEF